MTIDAIWRVSRMATAAVVGVVVAATVVTPAASAAGPAEYGRASPVDVVEPAPADPAAGQPAAVEPLTVPPAVWTPCGDGGRFQCATVRVPVDWARPWGQTIGIAVARLKASNPDARIGSLIINPGGPGGSGVRFTFNAERNFTPRLRERFDIVGFDPRGVGGSSPVRCDAALLNRYPPDYPTTRAQFDAFAAYNRALSADCRAHTGPVFNHVDTISAARDMDAVRAALGERKATFYGVSYGTQLFSQYLELFPHRVRAMTLDSNSEHTETNAGNMIRNYSREFENAYTQFALWCLRTPGCALGGRDARTILDELRRRAERGELADPAAPTTPITPTDLLNRMFGEMYSPDGWPEAAAWLARLHAAPPGTGGAPAPAADVELGPNAYQTIVCQDWKWGRVSFHDAERIRRQALAVAPHTRISPFWSDVIGCIDYKVPMNNPQRRLIVRGAPKILLTNSRYDVATALFSARGMATQIPTATLLIYDGVGHGDYWLSPCAQDAIDTYLITVRTPRPGTRCPAVWPSATQPPSKAQGGLVAPWQIPGVGGGPPGR